MKRVLGFLFVAMVSVSTGGATTIVDFEELGGFNGVPPSGIGQFFNGYGAGAPTGTFATMGVLFGTREFGPGWSYSTAQDTTTPGFTNQFAAAPGSGSGGSNAYGTAFLGSATTAAGVPTDQAVFSLPAAAALTSIDLANATYTAQYILNGLDGFGTPDFDANAQFSDGDFYRVTITGYDGVDATGAVTGSLDIDLANYGGPGTADDQFLSGWSTVDLSSFGLTSSLAFSATSSQISDFGQFGIFSDVPAYLAVDNFSFTVAAVPEPSSMVALALLVGAVGFRRRR